jgi:hypothetical protein
MYGRFLKEAADITRNADLAAVGDEVHAVGDMWQVVAQIFKCAAASPTPVPALNEASAHLLAIADCEQGVWEKLQQLGS